MDGYTGKRAVNELVPGKGSGIVLKDRVNVRERNAQFCSRRLNSSMKGAPNVYFEKAKSLRPSLSGKEIIGSSSAVYSAVRNARKSSTNLIRKLSSQVEIDSSGTSSVEEEQEVSELVSAPGKIQRKLQPVSEETDSGEVTVMEVGSSSVASNTRQGRSFIQTSVTLSSGSASRSTQGNTSKYGLRNLRCNPISVGVPSGCSSTDSSLNRRKNTVRKRISEGEGSSSTWGKKSSGSSFEGPNNISSLGISRRARNWSSNRDGDIVSSVRTQRPNNSYARGRLPNQGNGNTATLNVSPVLIPQASQSDIHIDLNAPASTESSSHASSFSRSGRIAERLRSRSIVPSSSSETGIYHYNMNGIAEVLLSLERIEQDEDLTYEQFLVLETGLLLDGLNIHDQHRDMRLDIDNMSYEELLALEERMGTVSTALPEEALSKCIKKGIYETTSSEDSNVSCKGEEDDIKCSICQEEYVIGDGVGMLRCEHMYHLACIQQWLRMKNQCPICKASPENTESCLSTS